MFTRSAMEEARRWNSSTDSIPSAIMASRAWTLMLSCPFPAQYHVNTPLWQLTTLSPISTQYHSTYRRHSPVWLKCPPHLTSSQRLYPSEKTSQPRICLPVTSSFSNSRQQVRSEFALPHSCPSLQSRGEIACPPLHSLVETAWNVRNQQSGFKFDRDIQIAVLTCWVSGILAAEGVARGEECEERKHLP